MRKFALGILCTAAIAALGSSASATLMTANLTVDNAFNLYVSTDDTVPGAFVGSGSNWGAVYTFSNIPLTPGVTNYIHVMAQDSGAPAAFLGSFDLSDSGFEFVNSTQHLITTPTDWNLSFVAFGTSYQGSITSAGVNGVGPWGFHSGIDASAEWLAFNGSSTNYFSSAISPVPEPTTLGLLAMGPVLLMRRKPR